MMLTILVASVLYCSYLTSRSVKEARLSSEAFDLHCDMFDKYLELANDPLMSYLKWKEWLPVFEAADERCRQLSPETVGRVGRVSDFVKRAIRDDGYEKDSKAVR